jgi:protein-S-isoprenylcysteine O-methyltransferase Ste14
MSTPARDHAGVYVPPPFLYALPFVVGWLIERRRPAPIVGGDGARSAIVLEQGAGWALVAVGVALALSAFYRFGRANTGIIPITPTTTIVAAGPYRFTRNPMYLGMAVVYLGATLLLDSYWPLLLFPVAIAAVSLYVIAREERYLEGKFGEEYRGYKRRVRRWI